MVDHCAGKPRNAVRLSLLPTASIRTAKRRIEENSEDGNLVKGLIIGLLFSIPLWAIVILAIKAVCK
jgi:hypothetical protein